MKRFYTSLGSEILQLSTIRGNSYLVRTDKETFLVDTGAKIARKRIERKLAAMGIYHLDAVYLTHIHLEHVRNVAYFQQKYNAPVYVHIAEYRNLVKGRSEYPVLKSVLFQKIFDKIFQLMKFFNYDYLQFEPVKNALPLFAMPNEKIRFSHYSIEETIGHTSGSISIIVDNEIALVGDALVHHQRQLYQIAPEEEVRMRVSSHWLGKSACMLFLPGHGKEISKGLSF